LKTKSNSGTSNGKVLAMRFINEVKLDVKKVEPSERALIENVIDKDKERTNTIFSLIKDRDRFVSLFSERVRYSLSKVFKGCFKRNNCIHHKQRLYEMGVSKLNEELDISNLIRK
jgi:hypothetical protein